MVFQRFVPLVARIGIRQRLSLVVLVAIAPLFALLLFGAVADRRIAVQSAISRATDRARLGAQWQDDGFEHARDVLNVLRRLPPATRDNPFQCQTLVQQIATLYPQFTSIGFADPDSIVRCINFDMKPLPFHDTDVFRTASKAGASAFVIGKYLIGPISHKPIVVVAEPLPVEKSDETQSGIVFASLDLEWAAQHAEGFESISEGTISLIDTREATILARSPDEHHAAGRPLEADALVRAMVEHLEGGSAEVSDREGVAEIVGFAPLGSAAGLMVAVSVPLKVVLAAANQRLGIGMACAFFVSILAATMAWLFADRTQVHAIRSLVGAAERLGAGELDATADMKSWQAPEFRALSETLAIMARHIASAQADLKENERQLRLLADYSNDMIIHIREGGDRLYVSPACRRLTGWEPEEMLGMMSQDTIHPDDLHCVFDPRMFEQAAFVFTYRMRHKAGHYIWLEGSVRGLPNPMGHRREGILVVRDVEQRIEAERCIKESEARYRLLEEQGTDMVFRLDHNLVRQYVSPACFDILGYRPEELIGVKPVNMAHPDDAKRVAAAFRSVLSGAVERTSVVNRIRHRSGQWVWVEAQIKALVDPQTGASLGIIGSLRDISVRKAAEDQLEDANRRLETLARIDGLTGLGNRRRFDEIFDREYSEAATAGTSLALVMIDVDRFKLFNDRYGHVAGDDCLRKVSRAIESVLYHPSDVAMRYGGEEFAVLLPNTDEAGAEKVAERIRQAVADTIIKHEGSHVGIVSISAGVAAIVPDGSADGQRAVLLSADLALYASKNQGRNTVVRASLLDDQMNDDQSNAA